MDLWWQRWQSNKHKKLMKLEQFNHMSNIPIDDFISHTLYSAIPLEIRNAYKHTITVKNSHLLSFKITKANKDIEFRIRFITLHNNKTILRYVHFIYDWITFCAKYGLLNNGCISDNFTIFLWLTPATKQLPLTTPNNLVVPLKPINVNSGFTYACPNKVNIKAEDAAIMIFRQEEWKKLLIHECFHSLGLEYSHTSMYNKQQESEWLAAITHGHVQLSEPKLFEAYCETWATILWNIIKSSSHTLSVKNMKQEIDHSYMQCIKIAAYYHIYMPYLFGLSNNNPKTAKIYTDKYEKNTSVYSYYFLKWICLRNWTSFIEHFTDIQFTHIESYQQWLSEQYSNPDIFRNHDNYIKKTRRNTTHLRMTRI